MRLNCLAMARALGGFLLGIVATAVPQVAWGDIFVSNFDAGTISVYSNSGEVINTALISGLHHPEHVAIDGSNLYVVSYDLGTVAQYTTAGELVNPTLITGLQQPNDIKVSGSYLFVTEPVLGRVGQYSITGATVNAGLISGLGSIRTSGVAISGSDLFVPEQMGNAIGKFTLGTTPGTLVASNPSFITGLNGPTSITISGSTMYVTNQFSKSVVAYATSGAKISDPLCTGSHLTWDVAVSQSGLFVSNSGKYIGAYSLSGQTINASLIYAAGTPHGIAVTEVPEAASGMLFFIGSIGLLVRRRGTREAA